VCYSDCLYKFSRAERRVLSRTVCTSSLEPDYSQRHFIGRLCTLMSREAVVVFLFGLEALLTRVSRAQSSATPHYPATTKLLLVSIAIEPVSIFFALFVWALGNYCSV
jgi:hypothetical protein